MPRPGVEPGLQSSQDCVLSIERLGHHNILTIPIITNHQKKTRHFPKSEFLLDFSLIKTNLQQIIFIFISHQKMAEEFQTQNEQKNTVALVGMICSII